MIKTNTITIIKLSAAAVGLAVGLIGYFASRSAARLPEATKKQKKKSKLFFVLTLIAAWFLVGTVITTFSHPSEEAGIEFEMFSERVSLFGTTFAKTSVVMWVITAIIFVLSLVFRFVVFPRFDADKPKNAFQNIMEISVEATENFTNGIVGKYSVALAPYMFTLAVFMIFCAMSELFGYRPPTSDLIVTFSMGIITFVLINYYGFKKKGFGRLADFAKPNPIMVPMKIISDIAVPVSLACRLFGNMVGGMIVMELLKSALGGYSAGIPAVAGLYFNLFHPAIQAYIFVILSLTFINEALE